MPVKKGVENICEHLRHLAVDIDSVNLDPDNANLHGPESLADIRGSLSEFGQDQPLVANAQTRNIIKGNGRLEAARSLGWTHIAVVFINEGREKSMARALADNRSNESSAWDYDLVAKQMQEIEAEDAELRKMLSKLDAEANGNLSEEEGGDDDDSGPEQKNKTLASEMELHFNEHYDYIVVMCRDVHEWNRLVQLLELKEVPVEKRNKMAGLGRGVRAEKLLELLDGRVRDRNPDQGSSAQHEEDLFAFSDSETVHQRVGS